MTIKQTRGYQNAKKAIEKFLSQSPTKYSYCAVVNSNKENQCFYCYSYDYANELANFLEKYRGLKRFKSDADFDRTNYKYITIFNELKFLK